MIFPDVTSTVGGTPLVELGRLAGGLPGRMVAKLEMRNPCAHPRHPEPDGAAVLSGRPAGTHQMPGIGVGFVPEVLNRAVIDEIVAVTDDDAFEAARRLAREEGILAGVSSGAAIHAALGLAARPGAAGTTIVVLLADTGDRYVSSPLMTGSPG